MRNYSSDSPVRTIPGCLAILVFTLCLIGASCKKSNNSGNSTYKDSISIDAVLTYKVKATQPSPYDSAHQLYSDTFSINLNRTIGPPDYAANISGLEMDIYNSPGTGVAFTYKPSTFPFYILTAAAIPDVNANFGINKVYEKTSTSDFLTEPVLLSMGGGSSMGSYFNGFPPVDAKTYPSVTTYCKIVFTNKYTVSYNNKSSSMADGIASGYQIMSFGATDPKKYIQRWDFEIDFKGVSYNIK